MKTQKKSGLLVLPVFFLMGLLLLGSEEVLFAGDSELSKVVFYVN